MSLILLLAAFMVLSIDFIFNHLIGNIFIAPVEAKVFYETDERKIINIITPEKITDNKISDIKLFGSLIFENCEEFINGKSFLVSKINVESRCTFTREPFVGYNKKFPINVKYLYDILPQSFNQKALFQTYFQNRIFGTHDAQSSLFTPIESVKKCFGGLSFAYSIGDLTDGNFQFGLIHSNSINGFYSIRMVKEKSSEFGQISLQMFENNYNVLVVYKIKSSKKSDVLTLFEEIQNSLKSK
jgi:hypothetical protein